jgi:hypothetical protein
MDFAGIPWNVLDGIGVVGLCVLGLVAFSRGWVCTGRELREANRRADRWEEVALKSLGVADRTTVAAEITHDVLQAQFPAPEVKP